MPDLASGAAALALALRREGVPVTPQQSARLVRAVELRRPAGRRALYLTARTCLLTHHSQTAAFDRVFASLVDGAVDPADSRGDTSQPQLEPGQSAGRPPPGAPPRGGGAADHHPMIWQSHTEAAGRASHDQVLAAASATERLAERSFASLDVQELARVRELLAQFRLAPPQRRTHRRRQAPRGERIDLRRTVRMGLRTGGEPLRLHRRRRVQRPRRLVLLLDVSGSMEPYARVFLQLLQGAVGGARAEAFVFATRLTRLTRPLQGRNPEAAFQRAVAAAPDWAGGTRIGDALAEFTRRYGRGGMAHGAVVVVLSDGWETGDPAVLGEQAARLRRLAHRVIWVNPRAQDPRFEPLAGGMAAALESVDRFVPGHSLEALAEVVEAIRSDSRAGAGTSGRGRRRSRIRTGAPATP